MKKLKEKEDYNFVHHPEHPDAWAIRLEGGPFPETTLVFGAIRYDDVEENIKFDFSIVESPDEHLTEANEDLQQYAGDLLFSVIEDGLEEGFVKINESEN